MAKRRRTTRPPGGAPPQPVRRRPPPPTKRRLPSIRVVLGALVVVAAIGFVGLAFLSSSTAQAYTCADLLQPPAEDPGLAGMTTDDQSSTHVAPGTKIRYASCPPTSGQHFNARGFGPLPARFYGPDADASPGGWVHNLEHGYVVALYRCEGGTCPSSEQLEGLRSFATTGPPTETAASCGIRSKLVVARFDQMSTPFALLAWDRALLLDAFDEARAQAFAGQSIDATAPERAC